MIAYFRQHRFLRLVLCLLVALVVIIIPICRPVVIAHAAVVISTGAIIAIVSTVLLSFGITFANAADRNRVSMTYYNNSSSAFKEWVSNSIIQFPGTPPPSGGDDNDPSKSGLLGAVLSLPTTLAVYAAALAAGMFARKTPDAPPVVEDTSGLVSSEWRKAVGKTFAQASSSFFNCIPMPITYNVLPSGSPTIGTSYYPIRSDLPLLPYADRFSAAQLTDFVSTNSNHVFRTKSTAGVTYDYRFHFIHTEKGLVIELSENGVFKGTTLAVPFKGVFIEDISFMGEPRFTLDSRTGNILSIGWDSLLVKYVKSDGSADWNMSSGYFSFIGASLGAIGSSTILGMVDGRYGIVPPISVAYNPSVFSDNIYLAEQALKEQAAAGNQTIIIQVPATDTALNDSRWQDIVNAQDDYIRKLEQLLERLEQGQPDPKPDPDPNPNPNPQPDPDLSIPKLSLPEQIITVFPFSIPFDIINGLKCFIAEPVRPRFVVPFEYGDLIDYDIVLEIPAWLDPVVAIIRWGEYMVFLVGLAVMTRNYIKW